MKKKFIIGAVVVGGLSLLVGNFIAAAFCFGAGYLAWTKL